MAVKNDILNNNLIGNILDKKMQLVVAYTFNKYGIGINNKLPWHIPEDIEHFKELTVNNLSELFQKVYGDPKEADLVKYKDQLDPLLQQLKEFDPNGMQDIIDGKWGPDSSQKFADIVSAYQDNMEEMVQFISPGLTSLGKFVSDDGTISLEGSFNSKLSNIVANIRSATTVASNMNQRTSTELQAKQTQFQQFVQFAIEEVSILKNLRIIAQ